MQPISTSSYHRSIYVCIVLLFISCSTATAQLSADFSMDKTGGCVPLAVSFTNNTTGASATASYFWNFGNGNTSSVQNPGAIFNSEQTYNVTLTVTDGGSTSIKTKQITVNTPPLIDFSAAPATGCLPATVNFSITAPAGNNTYTWDFGDGNTEQDNNATPSHVYTVPQTATVSVTVSNSFGCTKTLQKDNLVKILPAVSAAFSADKTILCRISDAVQFTNSSTGPGTLSYLWDFGDGVTSTLAAPAHVFNVRGTYTVILTVTSSAGCTASSTQTGFINVANFTSDFTVPSPICTGAATSFNNTSTPSPSGGTWLVDGINANSYYTTLNYSFSVAGPHTVQLTNTFGSCTDSVSKTITINDVPVMSGFSATKTANCGAPVMYNFKDTSAGAVKWAWNFTAPYNNNIQSTIQAPSYTYTYNDEFNVLLTVTNAAGCVASASQQIAVTSPYVVINHTGQNTTCGPFSLQFSTYSTDSIVAFNWNFGDSTHSTDPQPSHLFQNPGEYGVSLTYTTLLGCTGNVSYGTVTVYGQPKADFTTSLTNVCGNNLVEFDPVPHAGNYLYRWDFGDGSTVDSYQNGSITTHRYQYDSAFTVSLIVYNSLWGCADTMIRTNYITVLPPFPHIDSYTNTCSGTRGDVTFKQSTLKADLLTWDFGDGITQPMDTSQKILTHTYTQGNQYSAKLTAVAGSCTVSDSIYLFVHLKQTPLLTADKTVVCASDVLKINITNYERNYMVDLISPNFNMDFYYGDSTHFNGTNTVDPNQYVWSAAYSGSLSQFDNAKKNLRVILTSVGFNCQDTSNYVPLVIQSSQAAFQVITNNICFKMPVVLQDASITNNKIISWRWDFGDGSMLMAYNNAPITHIYHTPGNYFINLTIIDSGGCSSSSFYSQSVTVNGAQASFTASTNNTTVTLPVTFYNNTINYNSNNTQYSWQFGDGTSSTAVAPVHAYALPGQYTVRLIANSLTGCADTAFQVINVISFAPAFAVNSSYLTGNNCPPVLVKLVNNSYNYTSVKWDFGDGTTADNLNYPSHIYEKAGKYIITLYVYGPGGLTATYTDSVTISVPSATASIDKKEGCMGLKPTFTATIQDAGNYTWDYGDGSITTGSALTTQHEYDQAGTYYPYLMLNDSNGCNTLVPLADTINIHPNPVATISPQGPRICSGQSVALTAGGGAQYSWSPATGLNNPSIATPGASPAITTSYTVTVKDNIGCSDTATETVTVMQPGKITASPDASVCLGRSAPLTVTGAASYKWIGTTTGLSNTGIGNPLASPAATTIYTVTGTDQDQCFTDTVTIKVTVLPLPTVSIPAIADPVSGTPVTLNAITSNDVVQWSWSPATGLSCSNCPAPVATPTGQQTYSLTVTNGNGCTATADVSIRLQCQESRVFIPAAFSPNGDGKNDVFSILGISLVKHWVIYNRAGTAIYERNNFNASDRSTGWDGTYKGEPLPPGTYAYFAEMDCPTGGSFTRAGTVILVR